MIRKDVYRPVGDSTDYDDSDWTSQEMESLAADMFDRLDDPEEIR